MTNKWARVFLVKTMQVLVMGLLFSACQGDGEAKVKSLQGSNVAHEINNNFLAPRDQMLGQLRNDQFDVLVIGGGATGAGSALDAASRGLKTALIESHDFAFGTSSRSTKLVHGGIRYLENAVKHLDWQEYELVRDALQERKRFLVNAPHLTNPLPILTPVYSWFAAIYYWIGLKMYDVVAGKASLGSSQFLSKAETLSRFPMMKKEGLKGAVLYYDGQFNDARMNVTLILSAIREGAIALNYMRAESLIKENEKVIGVMAKDLVSGLSWPVRAKVVINATGPYADHLRQLDNQKATSIMVASQGTHILLPPAFSPPESGMVIPDTKDGRVLFLLPWQGKTLAGTTDQAQEISEYPEATSDEVGYIIEHLQHYLAIPLRRDQVLATWSGLRPLARPEIGKSSTAAISRDHLIEVSASNLLTIVGGKWTTYRKMAQDVIDSAIKVGGLAPLHESRTKDLKLVGADHFDGMPAKLSGFLGLEQDIAQHLVSSYGDRAHEILKINREQRLAKGFPYIEAEVIYALRNEYAIHASDILARRLRLAFLDQKAALEALPNVIKLMTDELKWDEGRVREEYAQAQNFLRTMLVL